MTSPFEDQLRADLHAATSRTAYESVDPAQIIGEGSRLVRRRRLQRAVGSAAAVAVLSVGGFLATDHGRTTTAPPAGPTTTTTVPDRALLSLSGDGTHRFLAERGPGSDEVRVVDTAGANHTVVARLTVPRGGQQITSTSVSGTGVVVGLLPHGAHLLGADTDAPSDNGGYGSDIQPLGAELAFFAVSWDDASRTDGAPRFLWADHKDRVWDMQTPLASARFDVPDSSRLVWVDADQQTWGVSDALAGTLSEKPLEPYSLSSMGSFTSEGQGRKQGTFGVTGLLPFVGATNVRATWVAGVTVSSPLQVSTLGDRTQGRTVFDAVVRTDGELPEPLLRSVTFTGPDGKEHTHTYTGGGR